MIPGFRRIPFHAAAVPRTWIHHSTTLLDDACHSTLPELAQGAAQAIEDAAVLSVVLARLPDASTASINTALRAYEARRKERACMFVEMAAASGRTLHLGEGAAKVQRDRRFAAVKEGRGKIPDNWADADVMRSIYSRDCMWQTEKTSNGCLRSALHKQDR